MDCRLKESRLLTSSVFGVAFAGVVLAGLASTSTAFAQESLPLVVPKAKCGPHDNPETALQGQVPAPLRAAGFKGFNCNLELLSQAKIDGANWQTAEWRERSDQGNGKGWGSWNGKPRRNGGHVCAYHGTASPSYSLPGRNPAQYGVPVIDITNPKNPVSTGFLQTTSMLDPWESLKVNERRALLGADEGTNGGGGPYVDFYDLSQDCRYPQLLSSAPVGTGTDGGFVHPVVGHEGTFAPDGLTYYGGDLRTTNPGATSSGQYFAVDTADPTRPKLITAWSTNIPTGEVHGMSVSDDGKRGYFVSIGEGSPATVTTTPVINGLLIYDLTQIQERKSNPTATLIGSVFWPEGTWAQTTIPVTINGRPYVIFTDEGGAGGAGSDAQRQAACAAGLPPYPMARIIDISNEKHPVVVSRLGLETHDPRNCALVNPDLVGTTAFSYGSHYCSVDDKHNATTLACAYFNSGLRVFDIRNPAHPREIAYYNPAGTTTASPGSNHAKFSWRAGGPDWCSAQIHMNAENGTLWSTCQDNGLLMLKFTNNVWPFPNTKTPAGGGDNGSN